MFSSCSPHSDAEHERLTKRYWKIRRTSETVRGPSGQAKTSAPKHRNKFPTLHMHSLNLRSAPYHIVQCEGRGARRIASNIREAARFAFSLRNAGVTSWLNLQERQGSRAQVGKATLSTPVNRKDFVVRVIKDLIRSGGR
jgi:hypothetical protein